VDLPSTAPLSFGLGLLDTVSDRTIRVLAEVRYRDGAHGRPSNLPNGVGRFGRKVSVASPAEFNAGPFVSEIGITNRLTPSKVRSRARHFTAGR
jgi:CxxC motif-containing protein (DUF1111 family)